MKKILLLAVFLTTAFFARTQVIANFEDGTTGPLTLHVMGCGAWDDATLHPVSETFTVVDNPLSAGINTSSKVLQFNRRGTDDGGLPWGGFWANADPNIDLTANKYLHVKVLKTRISPLRFKMEGGPTGTLEQKSMYPQTKVSQWEDIVFKFDTLGMTGLYPVVACMPDFEDPLLQAGLLVIYIDDILLNNDPNPITDVICDFEDGTTGPLTLHVMGCGAWDDSSIHPVSETFIVVDNPLKAGINTSNKVLQFNRRGTIDGGMPWGGFWANADPNIDLTSNKYVHAKVLKTRISPLHFKMEGGGTGNLEQKSMYPQTKTEQWEDIVFKFDTLEMTGLYPVVAFMPDFEDPLLQSDLLVIYIDDILLNNDPNPIIPSTFPITFNVNMSYWESLGKFHPVTGFVDVAGSFNGWDGSNHHLSTINDSIYSITIDGFEAGDAIQFKFRINGSWADSTCEFPAGGPNRQYTVVAGQNIYNAWYNNDSTSSVIFNVNMSYWKAMGKFHPATEFVDIAGSFNGWDGSNYHLISGDDSIYTITVDSLAFGSLIEFKFRINGSWADSTCEFPAGGPNRKYTIPAGHGFYSAWYNDQVMGIPENTLTGKIQLYPNPVGNILNIYTPVELSHLVVNGIHGQQVLSINHVSVGYSTIDVSGLSSGLYFVTYYMRSGGQLTQKMIKN